MIAIAVDRGRDGIVDLIFDENMVIDRKFNFLEKLCRLLREHHLTVSSQQNLADLGARSTMLLQEALSNGYLHTGPMFDCLEKNPGYFVLRASEDFNKFSSGGQIYDDQ